jgi:hypothetical protein
MTAPAVAAGTLGVKHLHDVFDPCLVVDHFRNKLSH